MKDIYVNFKGVIKGESRDKTHPGTVEVFNWTHTMRQPKSATASSSGGHTAERVEHGEMIFTKDIDSASPKLSLACSSGAVINDVEIFFYRAFGGKNSVSSTGNARHCYLKIELKNAIVGSVSQSVLEEGIPKEVFSLKYSAVKWTYKELTNDGTAQGAIDGAWNLATNQASLT
ncbi:MAG: hypothetical protein H6R13_2206 [Proteobacteria bacterium]|nr:hypothetical protein [Pseudomonadota bacterium]